MPPVYKLTDVTSPSRWDKRTQRVNRICLVEGSSYGGWGQRYTAPGIFLAFPRKQPRLGNDSPHTSCRLRAHNALPAAKIANLLLNGSVKAASASARLPPADSWQYSAEHSPTNRHAGIGVVDVLVRKPRATSPPRRLPYKRQEPNCVCSRVLRIWEAMMDVTVLKVVTLLKLKITK